MSRDDEDVRTWVRAAHAGERAPDFSEVMSRRRPVSFRVLPLGLAALGAAALGLLAICQRPVPEADAVTVTRTPMATWDAPTDFLLEEGPGLPEDVLEL